VTTEAPQTKTDSWLKKSLVGAVTVSVLGGVLVLALRGLNQPAASGTLSISAVTGSLTLEPLCDEPVTWDLPAGRVGRRSVAPGEPGYGTPAGAVTMTLAAGSRTRVTSPEPGVLRVSVEKNDELASRCPSAASPHYRLVLDGTPAAQDPVGFNYETRTGAHAGPIGLSLPVAGRVIIGQAVPEGADWRARSAPILLTGTILRRVKPWFGHDVMTVGEPERLDEGSIVDSHACLDSGKAGASPASDCSAARPVPAVGFFRTLSEGGLQVQLYAQGPAGLQTYRGPQHLIEVPLSTALWESDTAKLWGAFFLLIFACFEQVAQAYLFTYRFLEDIWSRAGRKLRGGRPGTRSAAVAPDQPRVNGSKPAEAVGATERYHLYENVKPADRKKTNR